MIHQVVHSQEKEEYVASLQDQEDAVEVEELWAGEENTPLQRVCLIRIGSFPLFTPGRAKEALGNSHVGQQ